MSDVTLIETRQFSKGATAGAAAIIVVPVTLFVLVVASNLSVGLGS